MACTWFGEISSCSCLIALPGPAWVQLSKICKPFAGSLYLLSLPSTPVYRFIWVFDSIPLQIRDDSWVRSSSAKRKQYQVRVWTLMANSFFSTYPPILACLIRRRRERERGLMMKWSPIRRAHILVQGRAKEMVPSCEKVLPGCTWMLSKTRPFSAQAFKCRFSWSRECILLMHSIPLHAVAEHDHSTFSQPDEWKYSTLSSHPSPRGIIRLIPSQMASQSISGINAVSSLFFSIVRAIPANMRHLCISQDFYSSTWLLCQV